MRDGATTGRTIADRYVLMEEVGRGGMAVVYKARDQRINRLVAVKVLYPFLAFKPANKLRFQREAQVVGHLKHPNIVEIFDYSGVDSEEDYIVSEFVEGVTLAAVIKRHGRVAPEIAALIIQRIADALAHAHQKGIVHRDIKPENIMLGPGGIVKLMDFGIAQMRDVEHMTITGTMVGSPCHMSPEHIEGRELDQRADIFSLGTVLYALCTGKLPFEGTNPHALLKNILDVRYVPAIQVQPSLGDEVSRIIDRCLRRDPGQRYQDCGQLEADLRTYLASFDINDVDLLARWVEAPEETGEVLSRTVVALLVERARRKVRRGEVAAALKDFDRALCMDANQQEILAELDRLQRTVEFKRVTYRFVLPALAAILGVLGIVWTVASVRGPEEPDRTEMRQPVALPAAEHVSPAQPVSVVRVSPPPFRDLDAEEPPSSKTPGPDDSEAGSSRQVVPAEDQIPSGGILPERRCPLELDPGVSSACWMDLRAELPGTSCPAEPGPSSMPLLTVRGRIPLDHRAVLHGRDSTGSRRIRGVRSRLPEDVPAEGSPSDGSGGPGDAPGETTVSTGRDQGSRTEERVVLPVTIEADPPAVEIFVDGKRVGQGKVTDLSLLEGTHHLRLHHPTCESCEDRILSFELRRDVPPPVLRERIRFKTAGLLVTSDHRGTVFVGERLVGRTGQDIALDADSPRSWKAVVRVLFDDRDLPAVERTVDVQAGRRTEVDVR